MVFNGDIMTDDDEIDPIDAILKIAAGIGLGAALYALLKKLGEQDERRRDY